MRAAVFHGREDIRIEDVPEPECGPGELRLEVHAVGICGTDAHEFASGPHMFPLVERHPVSKHLGPMIPGHELAGVVTEIGTGVDGFALGDLVVCGAGISCGSCRECHRGRTNLCLSYATIGLQRNGALAQYVTAPAAICLRVQPYGLTQDAAALAQPMAIAVHAMRRGRLTDADDALIIGAGGIGAFLTFAVASVTERLAVLDLNVDRLKIAHNLGAPRAIQVSGEVDPSDMLAEGMAPSVVYEVSGTGAGLETAQRLLPPGGRLVLVGLQSGGHPWDVRTLSLIEQELIGTNAHVFAEDMPTALELLASRKSSWADLAPVALSLDNLVDSGLRPLVDRRATRIKTLVDPWATEDRPTEMLRAQNESVGLAP
jgi:(R,R)-butanediol dehydrogenase/meso-butanediol dehydrogenase/diacetyl reductase